MLQSNVVVDHIAQFTAQRDQELLSLSLLQSVNNMMSSESSMILTLDKRGNVLSTMIYDGNGCRVIKSEKAIDEYILQACDRMSESGIEESNISINNEYKLLRSIYHSRKIEQFLIIDFTAKYTKVQSYVLSGILNIYNNFLGLLNDSQTDELTGLANRKTFDSAISKVFDSPSLLNEHIAPDRRKTALQKIDNKIYWLAIIDIDNFKKVNDSYGHLYGDEILIHVAQIIKSTFRHEDLQFRFGGEEFVVLLQANDQKQCSEVLERLRKSVDSYKFPGDQNITVSIGAVEFVKGIFHVTLIDYADQALYESKNKGRNRVTFFEDMAASGDILHKDIEGGDVELF